MAQVAINDDILERKFTDNFTYLLEKVSGIKEIVDILIDKRVINYHDRLKFLNENKLQKDKVDDVLQEVMTKKKFEEFIFALRQTGQFAVIETLTPTNKEFGDFIGLPEKGAVSSPMKTVIDMKTELKQQSHKIDELEADKMLKKDNNEKKQLEKDVQQLQHDLDISNEELKKKTEYVDMLEKQNKEVLELNKNLLERSKEDRQQIKEDRKERELDRKERDEDMKQRIKDMEQIKRDREQSLQIRKDLNTKVNMLMSRLDQNETNGTKQPPTPRSNIAYKK